jgi:hypothetical protein
LLYRNKPVIYMHPLRTVAVCRHLAWFILALWLQWLLAGSYLHVLSICAPVSQSFPPIMYRQSSNTTIRKLTRFFNFGKMTVLLFGNILHFPLGSTIKYMTFGLPVLLLNRNTKSKDFIPMWPSSKLICWLIIDIFWILGCKQRCHENKCSIKYI